MPVGSFAPSMLEDPMAHETMLVIKRLLPRLSLTPLLRQSIFMLKMQKVKPQISMLTSSPNTQGILPRSRPSSGMDAWDMISSFVIPDFIDPYALSVEDHWGDRKLTGVNLLKNWGKVTLKQCRNLQRDSFDYACTEDLTSMEWAKSLMMNSCDVLLVDRINEKFDELDLYEQGGVTYIKIALDEMFTISNTVVTTLQGFFEAFA
jgi:hypothetical protein